LSARDAVIAELASAWWHKASEDLRLARHLLAQGDFYPAVAVNSQQAAEKFIKAVLTLRQTDFPKTHDIAALLTLLARTDPVVAASLRPAEALSPFIVEGRYVGDFPEVTAKTSTDALAHAEHVFKALRPMMAGVVPPARKPGRSRR
jgi:HEPN domain-containing protein